ncbi:MAG: SHOCT domain-containing protein [Gammaproteobacteria bacterium]|nr:SHOCT domain-containing protein [Gammaproteobacteria bacterium]
MNNQPAASKGVYFTTDPKMIRLCRQLEAAPEWIKDKAVRYAIRVANKDPKLQRLIELRDKGFISPEEFWRRM